MRETVEQPSNSPTAKVTGASVAAAVSILIVYLAGLAGLEVTPEAASALTTVLAFLGGYLTRERTSVPVAGERGFVDTRFLLGALTVAVIVLALVVLL